MAGYNRIVIMGNLTRDPDYKQLTSGQAVCRLGIACNRQFKNKQTGAMVQEVCYIDIDVWGAQAESCKQYLQKGRPVLIEGRLKYDTWEDQEGKTRSKHSIVADRVMFLSSAQTADSESAEESAESTPRGEKNRVSAARLDTDVQIDAALSKQINDVKSRTQAKVKKAATPQNASESGVFTDEPPFQDDLPF
jgi:single-strand DNA-binding protein